MSEATPKLKVQIWVHTVATGQDLFLILKTTPERGEFWQPVTGSVEPGEPVEIAAKRELVEETGMSPRAPLRPVSEPFDFTSRFGPAREFSFWITVEPSERNRVRLDPHEHTDFQWVTAERAFDLLKYESNKKVLKEILTELDRQRSC